MTKVLLYGDLYLIDLEANTQPLKLANRIYKRSLEPIAFWLDDTRIVYAALYGGKRGIFVINIEGANLTEIEVPEGNEPFQILGVKDDEIYWSSWNNQGVHIWQSSVDGAEPTLLYQDTGGTYNIAPNGETIAWISWPQDGIHISPLKEMVSPRSNQLPTVDQYNIFWSPDNSKVMLCTYLSAPSSCYILSLQDFSFTEISIAPPRDDALPESVSNVSWSPDGQQVVLQNFVNDTQSHRVVSDVARILDLNSGTFSNDFTNRVFVFAWDRILWSPAEK